MHEIREHEIEIDHPIITEIINEIATQLEQDNLNIQDFINHNNPHITTFIATILSEQHEVSPHWERRFDIIMDEPGANFLKDIESALNRLKLKHIEKDILQNQEDFNKVTSDEEIETLQKIHQHLIEERKILTLKVGTVIVK